MEADRDAIREARGTFAREIAQLKAAVSGATQRIGDLERGRRIAQAAEAVRRLKTQGVRGPGAATLAEAETTLKRLRERQCEEESAAAALDNLHDSGAERVSSKLEAAGFGPRTRPTAADVLTRLRQTPSPPPHPAPML